MNIYCSKCKQELEIEKDMGTEIHVFPHECEPKDEKPSYTLPLSIQEALNSGDGVYRP